MSDETLIQLLGVLCIAQTGAIIFLLIRLLARTEDKKLDIDIEPSRNGYIERNRHVTHDSD